MHVFSLLHLLHHIRHSHGQRSHNTFQCKGLGIWCGTIAVGLCKTASWHSLKWLTRHLMAVPASLSFPRLYSLIYPAFHVSKLDQKISSRWLVFCSSVSPSPITHCHPPPQNTCLHFYSLLIPLLSPSHVSNPSAPIKKSQGRFTLHRHITSSKFLPCKIMEMFTPNSSSLSWYGFLIDSWRDIWVSWRTVVDNVNFYVSIYIHISSL